jgi:hypothetical protein
MTVAKITNQTVYITVRKLDGIPFLLHSLKPAFPTGGVPVQRGHMLCFGPHQTTPYGG